MSTQELYWLPALSSALIGVVTRVEFHQVNADGNIILRLWPTHLATRTSKIRTQLKHTLPPGWSLVAIIPPVSRNDVLLRKGVKLYKHPYFSIELARASHS